MVRKMWQHFDLKYCLKNVLLFLLKVNEFSLTMFFLDIFQFVSVIKFCGVPDARNLSHSRHICIFEGNKCS